MHTGTPRPFSMFTDCFASDDIEAAARRTGVVKRASQLTGKRWLARVTFRAWREATTTWAPWAAQVTPWDAQGAVAKVCDEGLCTSGPKVSRAARTGGARPESLHALFPGSGGSAAQAGATIPAGGDAPRSVLAHCGLSPWHIPEQTYVAPVSA